MAYIDFGPDVWAAGTRGQVSGHATSKPELTNVRLYPSGRLGPRHPWSFHSFTHGAALPEDTAFHRVRYDLGFTGHSNPGVLVIDGGNPKFFLLDQLLAEATCVLPVPTLPHGHSFSSAGDTTYLANEWLFDMRYQVTLPRQFAVVDTKTALSARFGVNLDVVRVRGSSIHDGRSFFFGSVFTGVNSTTFNRIWYSDPLEYGTFSSAAQYFDIDGTAAGLVSVGSNLYIWNTEGDWFVLQGRGNPANGTLSKLGRGRIPPVGRVPTLLDNNGLFLDSSAVTVSSVTSGGTVEDRNFAFLGDAFQSGVAEDDMPVSAEADSRRNTALIGVSHDRTRSLYNGVWTTDKINTTATMPRHLQHVSFPDQNVELLFQYTGAANSWLAWDRPTETYDVPGSGLESVQGKVTLPRLVHEDKHVRVREVVVDYYRPAGAEASAVTVTMDDAQGNTAAAVNTNMGQTTGDHQVSSSFSPLALTPHADIVLEFRGLSIERVRVVYDVAERKNL